MTFSETTDDGGSAIVIPRGGVTTTAAGASRRERSAWTSGTPASAPRMCPAEEGAAKRCTASIPRRSDRSSRIRSAEASSIVTKRTWQARRSRIPATTSAASEPGTPVTLMSRRSDRLRDVKASRPSMRCRILSIIVRTKHTPPLRGRVTVPATEGIACDLARSLGRPPLPRLRRGVV